MDEGAGMYTLGGAALGAFMAFVLVWIKEHLREKARKETEAFYLAVVVVAHLEEFAQGCYKVAGDDGYVYGEPAGGEGRLEIVVPTPAFAPLALEVEWKSLDFDLMRKCIDLPRRQSHIDRRASDAIDEDDGYTYEYFWRRQEGYAALGLDVMSIITGLRKRARLPDEGMEGDTLMANGFQQMLLKAKHERQVFDAKRIEQERSNPPAFPPVPEMEI